MTARPLSVADGTASAVGPVPTDVGSTTASIRSISANRSIVGQPRWRLLARSDAIVALAVVITVGLVWPGADDRSVLLRRAALALGCWTLLEVCLWSRGVYARARRHLVVSPGAEVGTVISTVVVAILVALAGRQVLPVGVERLGPSILVVTSLALCALVLPAARAVLMASYRGTGVDQPRVVVVGSGTMATDAAVRLVRAGHVELVGFVDDDPLGGQPVLGQIDSLPSICRYTGADRVLVVTPHRYPARTDAALRSLPDAVSVHVLPPYMELTGWRSTTEDLGGLTIVDVDGGSATTTAMVAKRALDVTVALTGLVLLAPLLLVVAVAVRRTSPGPVLYRQVRIGRHGLPFRILKFRSMREALGDADPQSGPLAERDSRVTTVGHLLRRTGVDEIPQLVNVLLGHMSLVGPRPLIPEETEALPRSVERRFDVRPGMTGLWQICGQHDLRWDEMCQLDVAYVASWSFRTDLRILALTPRRLLQGGGTIGTRWQAPAADSAS